MASLIIEFVKIMIFVEIIKRITEKR